MRTTWLAMAFMVSAVLVVGGGSAALAVNSAAFEERRIATERFEAAYDSAREASSDAVTEHASVIDRAGEAVRAMEDAEAIAALQAGFLDENKVAAITTSAAELRLLIADPPQAAPEAPAEVVSDVPAELVEAAASLDAWSLSATDLAREWRNASAEIETARLALIGTIADVGRSATDTAAAELAAAPLATAASRDALTSAAQTAAGLEAGSLLAPALTDFVAKAQAVRQSQVAAAAAAAAASSSAGSGGGQSSKPFSASDLFAQFTEPQGATPTIITDGYFLPGCEGHESWVFDQYESVPNGGTFTISRDAPYMYMLHYFGNAWSLDVATCINPY